MGEHYAAIHIQRPSICATYSRPLRNQPACTNDAADLQRVADVETCPDGFEHAADVKIVADGDYVAGHILQLAGFGQGMV